LPHTSDYCRQIETYLCRKNDGHLIRVVGPSFDLVSRWEADGVPIKVAFRGIDRYFERYYRKGPRRRPVRIDFCEADVLDVFDEWRRAIGLSANAIASRADAADGGSERSNAVEAGSRGPGLRTHLERVMLRLTNARATGSLRAEADTLIDRVSQELDTARRATGGVRGEARRALVERLAALDRELLTLVGPTLGADRQAIELEASEELADFRERMTPEAYARARAAVVDRLVRERFNLPTISF
jgi:hypothetical protein